VEEGGAQQADWPRISVVTPSYNQVGFLEETIRSVLLQNYPNLEYVVVDGGSDDGSVEVIEKYDSWIDHWVSEPDRGQSHAINKGFARCSGEIFAWLNSDDFLAPGALAHVAGEWRAAEQPCVIVGKGERVGPGGEHMFYQPAGDLSWHALSRWGKNWFSQPAAFFPADAYREVGGLDEELQFSMDLDLWLKLHRQVPFRGTDRLLAVSTAHPDAKTQAHRGKTAAHRARVLLRHGCQDAVLEELEHVTMKYRKYKQEFEPLLRCPVYNRLISPLIHKFLRR
jgi:glycosyltransferase involved in cell wall biosynthesis